MAHSTTAPPVELTKHEWRGGITSRRTAYVLIVAAMVLLVAVLVCSRLWPFQLRQVVQDLQEASDSHVQVKAFHRTYFPYPGCVLEGVVFTRGANTTKPLITIAKLTIRGTYSGILSRHLSRIFAEGARINIPAPGSSEPFHTTRSNITIDELVADGAILEFARKPDQKPLRFDLREVSLSNVGWNGPLTYRLRLHNPVPAGEIAATGKFGLWNQSDPAQTPLSGEYRLEKGDLSVFEGIAGHVSSTGKFSGKLGHIDISGKTETPDFEVVSSGHRVPLTTEFSAYVDGTNGNTFLKRVDAYFRKTHVVGQGSIATPATGHGKTALIDFSASQGRIEDVLGLFVKKERPPMSGAVSMRAKAEIPSGPQRFLERVTLRGSFGIGGGEFTKPATQQGVNKLSSGARGEKDDSDPETVLTNLTGQVGLNSGIARFSDLSFGVPGATARMRGTYNLIDHKIDLRGQMHVDSKISNTTDGVKALLLKFMDPFFKKRKKGEILPVRISGTYEKPSFGLDFRDKKAQDVPAPDHSSKPQ